MPGNIRLGDYILIVDSDTRVPRDCLLDAASEMEQNPSMAVLQYASVSWTLCITVTMSPLRSQIRHLSSMHYQRTERSCQPSHRVS